MVNTKLPTRKWTGRRNLIFFGDSISFGELVNPHSNWVTKLSRMVEDQYGTDYLVINCSINGNTTRQALERMPFDVQRYSVDLLCIQFGMNDCNYWETDEGLPRVSPSAYRSNLNEMVTRALQFGAQRILLPTSHPVPDVGSFDFKNLSYESNRREYSAIVRDVAQKTGAVLVDIEKRFDLAIAQDTVLDDFLMSDGMHLSLKGHYFYAEIFWPILREQIKRLKD